MRLGQVVLPATFLLVFAALLVGCGGDTTADTLSLEEYFDELEAAHADLTTRTSSAPGLASREETFGNAFLTLIFLDVLLDFQIRMADIVPPPEVEEEHLRLLAAGKVGADILVLLVEDPDTGLIESDASIAFGFFDDACRVLANIAEANDISVIITCEDGE